MNPDQLHDALGMLPEDLISEVDALRRPATPKAAPWKKILPTAACAAIVLLGALTLPELLAPKGSMLEDCAPAEAVQAPAASPPLNAESAQIESPAEEGPNRGRGEDPSVAVDEAAYPLTAHYLPVRPGGTEGGQTITVISSRDQLDSYLADHDPDGSLEAACENYDDTYFTARQLILLLTAKYRPAGSYSGNVLLPLERGSWSAERTGEESWGLRVRDLVPDDSVHDVVRQHIVLELPGRLISESDSVTLILEP